MAIKYPGQNLIGYGKAQVFDTSKLAEGVKYVGQEREKKRKEKKKREDEFAKNLKDIDISKIRNVDVPYVNSQVDAVSDFFHKNSAAIMNPKLDGGKASMELSRLKNFAVGEVQRSIGIKEEDKLLDDRIAAETDYFGTHENYELSHKRHRTPMNDPSWNDQVTEDKVTKISTAMTPEEGVDFFAKSKTAQNEMIIGNISESYQQGMDNVEIDKDFFTNLGYSEEESSKIMEDTEAWHDDLQDKNSDTYKRIISGQRTEILEGEKEITTTGTGFRTNEKIDSELVDKFNIGANGEILREGSSITGVIPGTLGLASVTGVRTEGNKIIADVKAPGNKGGPKSMGEFKKDGDGYKWVGTANYDKLPEDKKEEMDAFISAIESDPEFGKQVLGAAQSGTEFNTSEYGYEETETVTGSTTKTTTLDENLLEKSENFEEYQEGGGRLMESQYTRIKQEQSEYVTKWNASQNTYETTTEKGSTIVGLNNQSLNANPMLGDYIEERAANIVNFSDAEITKLAVEKVGEGSVHLFETKKEIAKEKIIAGILGGINMHRFKPEMNEELEGMLKERQQDDPDFTMDDLVLELADPFVKQLDTDVQWVRDIFKPTPNITKVNVAGEAKIENVGAPLSPNNYEMQVPQGSNAKDTYRFTTQAQGVSVQITDSSTGKATYALTTTSSGYRTVSGKMAGTTYQPPSFNTGRTTFDKFRPTKVETYFTATDDITHDGLTYAAGDVVPDEVAEYWTTDVKKAQWLMGFDGTEEMMIRLDETSKADLAQWMITRTKGDINAVKEAFRKGGIVYDFSKIAPGH